MNRRNIDPFSLLNRYGIAIDPQAVLHITSISWTYGVDLEEIQVLSSDIALDELEWIEQEEEYND